MVAILHFIFSELYQNVNYSGSRAKYITHEGAHVNFASDQTGLTLQ